MSDQGYFFSGLQSDHLEARPAQQQVLGPEEVRVRVSEVCLEPRDLRRCGEFSPGGGLVGRVQACGEAASAYADAPVLVSSVSMCGECGSCRRGVAGGCVSATILGESVDGGCAGHVVLRARWLTRLDGALQLEGAKAALAAGPALRAYGLYCRAGVSAGEPVLVFGRGPVAGILRSLAQTRGAKCIEDTSSPAAIAAALERLDLVGRPQRIFLADESADASWALQHAAPGSVIAFLDCQGAIDLPALTARELSLVAVPYPHPDLLTECAALVAKGELALESFAEEAPLQDFRLARVQAAFQEGRCLVLRNDPV